MSDPNTKNPLSDFNGEYPYNKSTITRSGHEIEFDDTPGSERIKIAHTAGTYVEINQDGRRTKVVVGTEYDYYKEGLSETVDGHKDVKIAGTSNLNIDNSSNENIGGNKYVGIGGNNIDGVDGSRYNHTGENKQETIDGDSISSIGGDVHNNIDGDSVLSVGGNKTEILNGDCVIASAANYEITTGIFRVKCSNFIIEADTITLITSSGTIKIDGGMNINSPGNISISGSTINLNQTL